MFELGHYKNFLYFSRIFSRNFYSSQNAAITEEKFLGKHMTGKHGFLEPFPRKIFSQIIFDQVKSVTQEYFPHKTLVSATFAVRQTDVLARALT
jgi:hypothetical protein